MSDKAEAATYLARLERVTEPTTEDAGNQERRRKFLTICADVQYKTFFDRHVELIQSILAVGSTFPETEKDSAFFSITDAAVQHLKQQIPRRDSDRRRDVAVHFHLVGHRACGER